jgi:1,4-alpha-glucan branching enzyme
MQSSSVNYHENSDSNNFTYIKQLIANGTKAVFCIFNHTDATGEKYGFNPNNTEYMAAIHETDDRAKQLISQVQLRSSED